MPLIEVIIQTCGLLENTPAGVTIHEIDNGLDTGPIIFQKKVNFKPEASSFTKTYKILREEIDNLFILNFKKIVNKNIKKLIKEEFIPFTKNTKNQIL